MLLPFNSQRASSKHVMRLLVADSLATVLSVLCLTEAAETWSIHREAPEFTEQSTEQEILATGIKVRWDCAVWRYGCA